MDLLHWYRQNKRPFPWRANRDPYRIWLSETMLQQTTTTAVIPYFERFVARFPTLESLAMAPEPQVLEAWAGLGYYSRARNLHKAAKALQGRGGFPRTYRELIELPGFGPYTSRAVSSLAFGESVGVVDGNVIRVLSRFYGQAWDWWQGKTRDEIQRRADEWVKGVSSYEMNQALMELGRTICTPKSPSCLLCPLRAECIAFKAGRVASLPKPKPRREREVWIWRANVQTRRDQVLICKNDTVPFLKGHWMLPGQARRAKIKPAKFDFKHSITHHDIYVTVDGAKAKAGDGQWVTLKELRQYAPTSLVEKAVQFASGRAGVDAADSCAVPLKTRLGRTRRRASVK